MITGRPLLGRLFFLRVVLVSVLRSCCMAAYSAFIAPSCFCANHPDLQCLMQLPVCAGAQGQSEQGS